MEVLRSNTPGKKVVVVGGGPAGMEAARVAGERGHNVVLFEAAAKLGGQLQLAAKASWRKDLISTVEWREAELEALGVEVRCNVYADAEDVVAENPDYVFVATGGMPAESPIPGAHLAVSSWDILAGDVQPAQEILICDHTGRYEAASTADHLSAQGAKVTLATIDAHSASEMGYTDRIIFHKQLAAQGVNTLPYLRLTEVRREGNGLVATLTHDLTQKSVAYKTDQVILETGTEPLADVYHELWQSAANNGVTDVEAMAKWVAQPAFAAEGFYLHRLGDAVSSRSIHAAILEAYRIAVNI